MEHEKFVFAPGTHRFRVAAQHQVSIALGIDDDDHIAACDVLGNDELGQTGLAHAGGADDQGMADAVTEVLQEFFFRFVEPDTVQPRLAFQRRGRRPRV